MLCSDARACAESPLCALTHTLRLTRAARAPQNCDMNEEMRLDCVDLVITATERYQSNYEVRRAHTQALPANTRLAMLHARPLARLRAAPGRSATAELRTADPAWLLGAVALRRAAALHWHRRPAVPAQPHCRAPSDV